MVFAHNVLDPDSEHSKSIRDEGTVAAPGYSFCAHQCAPFLPSQLDQPLQPRVEFRGLHVVGESTKRTITPPHVCRIASRVAQAPELSQVHVADPRGPQLCAQGLLVELWVVS